MNRADGTRHCQLPSRRSARLGIPARPQHAEPTTVFARGSNRPTCQGLPVAADHDYAIVATHDPCRVDFRHSEPIVVALATKILRQDER